MAVDLRAFNLAFDKLLRNETSAADRTSPAFNAPRGLPQVSFGVVGETVWEGWTPGRNTRVALRCHGRDLDQARKLYSECRDILLPPEYTAHGYYGAQTVTLEGNPVTVNFSGIRHNAGPNDMVDVPTGTPYLESFWLCPHY